jgi:hypothetical protein
MPRKFLMVSLLTFMPLSHSNATVCTVASFYSEGSEVFIPDRPDAAALFPGFGCADHVRGFCPDSVPSHVSRSTPGFHSSRGESGTLAPSPAHRRLGRPSQARRGGGVASEHHHHPVGKATETVRQSARSGARWWLPGLRFCPSCLVPARGSRSHARPFPALRRPVPARAACCAPWDGAGPLPPSADSMKMGKEPLGGRSRHRSEWKHGLGT